ncbi:PREDICTED: uncharacterized protein LOC109487452 [Branchiostoma belcheri]|uniref:Uncharacterized protein LOC109487452 n=1 Tax=Branchiostoma belcheri TaxID=7741 RepID=A0A6P5ALA3_BRABE|nr:PREDICTED: uncharacterized protein LOC109487452 [Branchiostoma belcheri]
MNEPVENPTDPADAFDVTDLPGRVEHLLHYVYGQYGGDITVDQPQNTMQASSPSETPDSEDVDDELKYLRNDESPTASLDSFELQLQHGQTPLGHPRDQIRTTSRGNTPPDRASVSPVTPREGPSPQSYGSKTPSPVGGAVRSTPPAKSDTKKSSKSDEKRFYHKSAAWWNDVYSYVLACLVFASIAKFLALLRFNGRMAMLSYVIRRATNELVHFTVMFFVIFLAYCQVTYLLLGTTLAGFGTFQASLEMMFAILLGDVDLSWVLKASPLSCVFLLTFILTLVMVIVNMFLAILVDSMKHVKDDVRRLKRENELTDFMIHRLKAMFKLADKTSHPSIKTTTPQPELKPSIRTTHEVATSPLPSPRTIPGVENTTEEKGQVAETSQMDKPVENPTDPAGAFDVTDLPGRVEHLLHYVYGQYGGDITIDRPQSTAEASSPSESPDSEDVDEELKYLRNDETSPTASLDSFELQLQHGQTPLGHPRDQIRTTSRSNTPPDRVSVSPVTPREGPSPQSYGSKTPSPVGGAVLSTPPAKSDTKKSSKSDEKRFYHKVSTSLSVDVVVHIASKESSVAEDLTDPDPDRPKKNLDVDTLSSKPPISPRVPSTHKKQNADKKRPRSDRRQKMTRRSSVSPKRDSQRDVKKSEYEDFGDATWGRAGARSATSSPVDTDCPSPPYPPPPRPFLPSREGSTTVQLATGWRRPRVQKLKFRHSMAGNISEVGDSDKASGLPAFTPAPQS